MAVKLLIVDDEQEILGSLSRYFAFRKVDTTTAETPFNAQKIVEKEKINIALLDINMPGMDGIELLQRIKKIDYSVQVIMMTGYPTFSKLVLSLEMGAVDYILKPFDNLDEVFDLVNESARRLTRWKKNLMETVKLQNGKREFP